MKFTLNWLKDHLETSKDLNTIVETLTNIGLEIENVEDKSKTFNDFTVAEVLKAEQHPDADRLKVCSVKTIDGTFQVVCGAPNARTGMKGIFAPENSFIPGTGIKLKKSKMFLSFSFLEGLGMPPLEAAIAGNKVIGYTGEGGKEYWRKPIFTEIHNGDIFRFCDEVIKNLEDKNFLKKSKNQRNKIIKMYLKKNEENTINKFLNKSLKNK